MSNNLSKLVQPNPSGTKVYYYIVTNDNKYHTNIFAQDKETRETSISEKYTNYKWIEDVELPASVRQKLTMPNILNIAIIFFEDHTAVALTNIPDDFIPTLSLKDSQ